MSLIEELEKLIDTWSNNLYETYDFYGKDEDEKSKMEGKNEQILECAEELKELLEKYKGKK